MSESAQLFVIGAVCCFVLGALAWAGACEWINRRERRRGAGWTQ